MRRNLNWRLFGLLVLLLGLATLRFERLEGVNGVPREVVVSVATRTDYLIAVELLSRQVALTLDCVEVAASLANMIIIFVLVRFVISQVLKEQFPAVLIQDLLLLAAHQEVPLLLVDRRGLRVVPRHAHGAATAANSDLVDARVGRVAR